MFIKNNVLNRIEPKDVTPDGCVVLPTNIVKIADNTFCDNTSVKKVILPDGLTEIGNCAFFECSNLVSVDIPASVNKIGFSAFCGCSSLQFIEIPYGVSSIECNTFASCSSLESVKFPETIKSISSRAFSDCEKLGLHYPCEKFKVFNSEMVFNGMKYEVGKWSGEISNRIIKMPYTEQTYFIHPFELFNYYSGILDTDIIICTCEIGASDDFCTSTKRITNKIKPTRRLTSIEIIRALNGEAIL